MSLRLQIDPGGEKYFSFAKRKLDALKQVLVRSKLGSITRHFKVEDSDIWLNSIRLRKDVFLDWIRITARVAGGLFELINADELIVLRDLETNPYTDEEQAIVDQAEQDLIDRVISRDEYDAIIAGLNETPLVDPALLDPGAINYGLVLPDRVLLTDDTFDTSKLLNDSFKRQHPAEYGNLDWYARTIGSGGLVYFPRNQFAYFPQLDGGTMVVARFPENNGPATSDISEALTVMWVRQIKRKKQAVPFDASEPLPADEDFDIALSKQASLPGALYIPRSGAVLGSDGRVAFAAATAENTLTARILRPDGVTDLLSTSVAPLTAAAGVPALRGQDTYLLVLGGTNQSTLSTTALTATLKGQVGAGAPVPVFSDSLMVGSHAGPLGLRVTKQGFGALYYAWHQNTNDFRLYFRTATGSYELLNGAVTGLSGLLGTGTPHQIDISSTGQAACAIITSVLGDTGVHYLRVRMDGAAQYDALVSSSSGNIENFSRSIAARWTPDSRYFVVHHHSSNVTVFNTAGGVVHAGIGLTSVTVAATRILPGTVTEIEGVTIRTYTVQVEQALDIDTPLVRERTMTVEESGSDVTVTWGSIVSRPRVWDAALGGGVWDTAAALD